MPGTRTPSDAARRRSSRLRIASRPRLALGAALAALVAGAGAWGASGAAGHPRPGAADLAWLAGEHSSTRALAAVPFLDGDRSLVLGHTPAAHCGPGSLPETSWQGRVPASDYASGRAARGYLCNASIVSHVGGSGGFRVARYTDHAGHTCAFYDSTLLFPTNVPSGEVGTQVVDMTDRRHPVRTATLQTPAMDSPHESLRLNTRRGLLVADAGYPATNVGFVDVYSVGADCRHPVLDSTLPIGPLGHESGFSPDGRTFWATATAREGITAIDLADPTRPSVVWHSEQLGSHGMALSPDGRRAYLSSPCCSYATAITGFGTDSRTGGLIVLDTSQVQDRTLSSPLAALPIVSTLSWPEISIPQNSIPVTIRGHRYLVEFDEYSSNTTQYNPQSAVGAARVIDIGDERHPRVVSRIRLAVHGNAQRASAQQDDPGASSGVQGYAAHYCAVPRQADPGILACSMIASGLRVFDLRDPLHPREVAYANEPATSGTQTGGYAMSAPAFDPVHGDVWYSDGLTGLWDVHLTNGAWPRRGRYPTPDL